MLLHAPRLGLELLRLPAREPSFVGLDGGEPDPFGGQPGSATQSLAEPGQSVPGLLGSGQPRRVHAQLVFELGFGRLGFGPRPLGAVSLLLECRLVGELLVDDRPRRDHVVGQQPGPGIAGVGLDDGRPASDLGLTTQGLQLTAELGEDVLETGEIALRGIELA